MSTRSHIAALLCLGMLVGGNPALAQDEIPEDQTPIHWGYSAFFGTGWYQIDDSRSVFVIRIPPRQVVRESAWNGGDRQIGIEIHYTGTIGIHSIDDIPGLIDPDNFGSITFTPGLELEIPVTEDFYLRPYAKAGWGTEFSGDYSSWMWYGGIKSRYRFPGSENDFALIGNIYYAGFKPDEGEADDIAGFLVGFEGSIPLGERTYREHGLDLDWHANYSHFTNEPVFTIPGDDPYTLKEVYEFGLALSPRGRKFDLWLWKPDRLGIAYKYDPDGEFSAITINFSSWFYR